MQKFQEVLDSFSNDLTKVNNIILSSSIGKSELIQQISNHLISSGGKRIRPILLIISAKLCGSQNDENQHYLASAVEMIHSATLLHDDVVDMSEIRRGKKTANALWDNKASILVGDYLFSLSFQLMVKSQNLAILDLLAKTSSIIADGEVLQLQNSTNINLTEEKYFEIIFGKTAVLFSACCEVGGLLNNRPSSEIEALRLFGKYLGMVFQIVDDILDYSSDEATLGKDIGNDFFEGKVTLPIIKTYQKADFTNKKLISDIFEKNFQQPEKNLNDFAKISDLINKFDGINDSKNIAQNLANQAFAQLNIFPNNIYKNHLATILEYSLQRIF
jgi:octaprenyl-diphosphate synthase